VDPGPTRILAAAVTGQGPRPPVPPTLRLPDRPDVEAVHLEVRAHVTVVEIHVPAVLRGGSVRCGRPVERGYRRPENWRNAGRLRPAESGADCLQLARIACRAGVAPGLRREPPVAVPREVRGIELAHPVPHGGDRAQTGRI